MCRGRVVCFLTPVACAGLPGQDVSKDFALTKFKFVMSDLTVLRRFGNYQSVLGDKAGCIECV